MISHYVKRRVDLVAALVDVGCDVASLEPMTKFQRIRALAPYIYALETRVKYERILFPESGRSE